MVQTNRARSARKLLNAVN